MKEGKTKTTELARDRRCQERFAIFSLLPPPNGKISIRKYNLSLPPRVVEYEEADVG